MSDRFPTAIDQNDVQHDCACEHDGNNVFDPCKMHEDWLASELATLQAQLDEQNGILGEMANTPDGAIIAELKAKLAKLQAEYDQEVISHDIEEKDLKEKIERQRLELLACERYRSEHGSF